MGNDIDDQDWELDDSELPVRSDLVGIRGWLILPAIGLIASPILGVFALMAYVSSRPMFVEADLEIVWIAEVLALAFLMAWVLYAAILFFQHKRGTPNTLIAYYVLAILISVGLFALESGTGANVLAEETAKQLAKEVLAACIWIPYFRVSKRVKATFVK